MRFKQKWFAENLTRGDGLFPVEVPGNVQYDYAAAKGFADHQYADNYKQFGALEDDAWRYSAELDYSAAEGETVWFYSGGIDYRCEIALNGEALLRHEGSFSRVELELTAHLLPGVNRMTVTIFPNPKRADAPVSRSQADSACKAPVCYGWGWHPRLLVSGMWQEAYIETRGSGWISAPSVTYRLSDDLSSADIAFDWECARPVTVSLRGPDGVLLWSGSERALHLGDIKLWWCAGEGEQTLYSWTMESADDKKSGRIGFRRSRLVMNAGAWSEPALYPKSRSDAPATFELNGRRIFVKGSNFLTPDIFTGRVTEETYRAQVTLARDAHMNIFRCWGGCGSQKDVFYDICDELGVMVWFEFPLACNNYSEGDDYLGILCQDAADMLLRFREHPSIALWCGGNELFNGWSGMTEQHLALRLLDSLCFRYDRNTPFNMTSPLNGMGHGNYFFFDTETGKDNFATFREARFTCYTEFGPPSIGGAEVIERVMPESSRVFPIVKDDPSWAAHYGTVNRPWRCQQDTLTCFPECKTLGELIEYSDILQSMAFKSIFEESRRQWPHCSMAINWCYNEPWYSVVNRNIIDYDSRPRPAYYAVKDALRPILGTAGIPKFIWRSGELFTADIVLHNDTREAVERSLRVTLTLGGEETLLLEWRGRCEAGGNFAGPTVRYKLPDAPGEKLMTLRVSLDDGTVNEYTLRYFQKGRAPLVRPLNE